MIKPIEQMPDQTFPDHINLNGPMGSAFALLSEARKICSATGQSFELISKEMQARDHEHLLKVFDREFGCYVTLHR